jgi:hypothetical protein
MAVVNSSISVGAIKMEADVCLKYSRLRRDEEGNPLGLSARLYVDKKPMVVVDFDSLTGDLTFKCLRKDTLDDVVRMKMDELNEYFQTHEVNGKPVELERLVMRLIRKEIKACWIASSLKTSAFFIYQGQLFSFPFEDKHKARAECPDAVCMNDIPLDLAVKLMTPLIH